MPNRINQAQEEPILVVFEKKGKTQTNAVGTL